MLNALLLYILTYKIHFKDISIISLTIADLFATGIGQLILVVYYILHATDGSSKASLYLQKVAFFCNCVATAASLSSMLFVSVFRYIQIKYPLRHQMVLTNNRVDVVFISIWIYSLSVAVIIWRTNFDFLYMYVGMLALLIVELSCIGTVSISVWKIVHRSVLSTESQSVGRLHSRALLIKSTKKMLTLILVFTLNWFPFAISGLVYFRNKQRNLFGKCKTQKETTQTTLFIYSVLLVHTNSLWNPLVYSLRDSRIKNILLSLIRKKARALCPQLIGQAGNTVGIIVQSAERSSPRSQAVSLHQGNSVPINAWTVTK